ncbi:hypothetical protein AMTR_s00012p00263140 [Amborella trichopoda]|uniref:Protein YIP n=1 Tax=Amborella trichopoda TaxID=13333 RepID=W1PDN5_AMBTC|nr:hypothetical protein AMTR_s00012p00263140 [Amborella trichopoda]
MIEIRSIKPQKRIYRFFHQAMAGTGDMVIKLQGRQMEKSSLQTVGKESSVSLHTDLSSTWILMMLSIELLIQFIPTMEVSSEKIGANPDLYGPVWISTTLVFMLAALGNCATYLMLKRTSSETLWSFDVSYINWAACAIYGYVIVVPVAFYFLLQYLGTSSNLTCLWCMWGYSLSVFLLSSLLMIVPTEIFRWLVIIITGSVSACFVALNMKFYTEGRNLAVVVISSFLLQIALALFIKICFFA